jgi:hypothetical protein
VLASMICVLASMICLLAGMICVLASMICLLASMICLLSSMICLLAGMIHRNWVWRLSQAHPVHPEILSEEKQGIKKSGTSLLEFRSIPLSELISNRFLDDLEKIFRLEMVV